MTHKIVWISAISNFAVVCSRFPFEEFLFVLLFLKTANCARVSIWFTNRTLIRANCVRRQEHSGESVLRGCRVDVLSFVCYTTVLSRTLNPCNNRTKRRARIYPSLCTTHGHNMTPRPPTPLNICMVGFYLSCLFKCACVLIIVSWMNIKARPRQVLEKPH